MNNNINIFDVSKINYSDRSGLLKVETNSAGKSIKTFPTYIDDEGKQLIFKPLSKTKPLLTPLFAYSEVFNSYIVNKYFDKEAPLYQLAICKGITDEHPKYSEKGILVSSFLKPNQKLVSLLEYFNSSPDINVDISNYENYCMRLYDYCSIFNADIFSNNEKLGEQLSNQVLISILTRNQNFHYENVGFIVENKKIISLAPPIDHEFSTMFLYPDNKDIHDNHMMKFDQQLDSPDSVLSKGIALISNRYPALYTSFIEKLKVLIADLECMVLLDNKEDYIGEFSSDDYFIGTLIYKQNKIELAKQYEKLIIKKRINSVDFFNNLIKEYIASSIMLLNVMQKYLILDKSYTKKER